MYVKEIKNKSNKPMYLLYDESGKIVTRVYKFILHLARIGNSKHTLRSYAFRLKLLYEWLEVMNLDCLDIVQGRDATHKAPLEYLSDFITLSALFLLNGSGRQKYLEVCLKKY